MAANPYPHMRHESTYFSDKYDALENGLIVGAASAGLGLAKGAARAAWWTGKQAAKVGLAGSSMLGSGAMKASSTVGKWALSSLMSDNPLKNPVGVVTKAAYRLGGAMVDYRPAERVYNETKKKVITKAPSLKLTKFGGAVVLGGSLLSGASAAWNKFETRQLGQVDTKATTSTPDYTPQEYTKTFAPPPDDAGATGDLVFALFKNRKGGSLL